MYMVQCKLLWSSPSLAFEYLDGTFEAKMCFGTTWCSLLYMLLLDQVESL